MTDIQPRFFETENKLIAHLEWEAIRILCFEGSHMNIADAFPKFEQRQLMTNLCRINSAIYATDRNSLINEKKFLINPIGFIEMSLIESINIDTLVDLKYANFISNELWKKNL